MNDIKKSDDERPSNEGAPRMTSAAALKTHLTLLVGLAFCALAFWFELGRALRGNELSWAYVFEWPLLGLFAVYMWWKLLHPGFTMRRRHEKPMIAPGYEGMLAAWQEEQRRLEETRKSEESDTASRSDRDSESSQNSE